MELTDWTDSEELSLRIRRVCWSILTFVAIAMVLLASPASGRAEDLSKVDDITILPIVFPARQTDEDRSERLSGLYGELDEYIYKALLRKLSIKGYVLDKPRKWTVPANWDVETLIALAPADLAALMPESAEYGAFLYLENLQSTNNVVATSANAAVSARIVERESGAVVWERRAETKYSENLLQHLFFGPPMWLTPDKHAAVEEAFSELFDELPERY